jgi:hypothetical protein
MADAMGISWLLQSGARADRPDFRLAFEDALPCSNRAGSECTVIVHRQEKTKRIFPPSPLMNLAEAATPLTLEDMVQLRGWDGLRGEVEKGE